MPFEETAAPGGEAGGLYGVLPPELQRSISDAWEAFHAAPPAPSASDPEVAPDAASADAAAPVQPSKADVERALLAQADRALFGALTVVPPLPATPPRPMPRREAAETGEEGPSFQVSIGRLEIVTAPTPQPQPAPRRAETRASLKDYLDRRRVNR